jgi:hypothetical protein
VEAANDAFAGGGVVVLREVGGEAVLREELGVEGLHEPSALVAKDARLDDENSPQFGLTYVQAARMIHVRDIFAV